MGDTSVVVMVVVVSGTAVCMTSVRSVIPPVIFGTVGSPVVGTVVVVLGTVVVSTGLAVLSLSVATSSTVVVEMSGGSHLKTFSVP
jgi:hypothetical protein